MPDTEIIVSRANGQVRLKAHIPWSDVRLALSLNAGAVVDELSAGQQARLRAYFVDHLSLSSAQQTPVMVQIETIRLLDKHDEDVGDYREIEIIFRAEAADSEPLTLSYDAVIHRIVNHRALVSGEVGEPVGTIQYSLANKRANTVRIAPEPPVVRNLDRSPDRDVSTTNKARPTSTSFYTALADWSFAIVASLGAVTLMAASLIWIRRRR
jgi:hypothetical protein